MGKQENKDVQQNGYDLQKHRNLHIYSREDYIRYWRFDNTR